MAKFFGEIDGVDVHFKSIKDMKSYPYKPDSDVLLFAHSGGTINSVEEVRNYVGIKRDRYGYSMNKKDKGQMGYYKNNKDERKG